jgi:hypothetical protein
LTLGAAWADVEFWVPHSCGLCKGAISATDLFDLTLSLLARYDVCQYQQHLSAAGL